MAYAMVPIFTQTVGAGGAASITFNNIPSNYTDLRLVASTRGLDAGASEPWLRFNGDSANNYSMTRVYANGSTSFSDRASNTSVIVAMEAPSTGYTANTFSNAEVCIPNYTSSTFKQIISDAVAENNATSTAMAIFAGLWRNASSINSITIGPNGTGFAQHSTFTLYGIKNA